LKIIIRKIKGEQSLGERVRIIFHDGAICNIKEYLPDIRYKDKIAWSIYNGNNDLLLFIIADEIDEETLSPEGDYYILNIGDADPSFSFPIMNQLWAKIIAEYTPKIKTILDSRTNRIRKVDLKMIDLMTQSNQ
jgi:hypothetical protein